MRISSTSTVLLDNVLRGPHFENVQLKSLPVDNKAINVCTVPNACFARVTPTPIQNPRLILHSREALDLIGLATEIVQHEQRSSEALDKLVQYLAGNLIWPDSVTVAHCYCGYQFGIFAGQLGDGAAISLGQIINHKGEIWELQIKGAGLTPFSRQADGRKVLRSCLREFLCSEAMHYLGVPTTRAATVITADEWIERDIFYTGQPILEKLAVINRLAPTFIRFGSFEIAKSQDPITGQCGPSMNNRTIVTELTNYVIQYFYPDVWANRDPGDLTNTYIGFFTEVVKRTASLVAHWQSIGFCHGVLNTDNMSIVGLTLDYGPFGFMDQFTWDHVCNTSDTNGRYSYAHQPGICAWNCLRLAECLVQALGDQVSGNLDVQEQSKLHAKLMKRFKEVVEAYYMPTFWDCYLGHMRKKLGILTVNDEADKALVHALFDTMEQTGADFTNTFLALEDTIDRLQASGNTDFISIEPDLLIQECCDINELLKVYEPGDSEMGKQSFRVEETKMLKNNMKAKHYKDLKELCDEEKRLRDADLWTKWLQSYCERIRADGHASFEVQLSHRLDLMRSVNPRIVLRNYLAEIAIKAAEAGDNTVAQNLFDALRTPFKDPPMAIYELANKELGSPSQGCSTCSIPEQLKMRIRPPGWARKLRVSCSS